MANANTTFQIPFGAIVGNGNPTIFSGDVTIEGNATINGTLNYSTTEVTDFVPSVDKNDLGNTSKRWDLFAYDANVANSLRVGGTSSLEGAVTILNTLGAGNTNVTGFANVSGLLTANGNTSLTNSLLTLTTNATSNVLTVGAANLTVATNVLVVDSVNSRVGIKNTAPDLDLRVTGAIGSNRVSVGNSTVNVEITNTGIVLSGSTSTGVNPGTNTAGVNGLGNSTATWVVYANSINVTNGIAANGTLDANQGGLIGTSLSIRSPSTTETFLRANSTGVFPKSNTEGSTFGNTTARFEIVANSISASNSASLGNTTITGQLGVSANVFVGNSTVNAEIHTSGSTVSQVRVANTTKSTTINLVGISSNGTLTIDGNATLNGAVQTISGNVNFDSGAVFIDAATNRLGIGTTTPSVSLDVTGSINATGTVTAANISGSNIQGNFFLGNGVITGVLTSNVYTSNLSGTATVSGTTAVTGSGTNFNQVLVSGDQILFGSCTALFTVSSVASATSLTLTGAGPTVVSNTFVKLVQTIANSEGIYTNGKLQASGNLTVNGVNHSILGNTNFDSGTLFIDSVNNRIGINNTAPAVDLRVTGIADISSNVIANTFTISTINSTANGFFANNTALAVGNSSVNVQINTSSVTTGSVRIPSSVTVNASGVFPASNTVGTAIGNTTARVTILANTINVGVQNATSVGVAINDTYIYVGTAQGSADANNISISPYGIDFGGVLGINPLSNTSGTILGSATKRFNLIANTITASQNVAASAYLLSSTLFANSTALTLPGNKLYVQSSYGTAGQVLYSNGSGSAAYWGDVSNPTATTTATPSTFAGRDANADIYANNFYSVSDAELKENINEINIPEKVLNLSGKQYNFKGSDKTQYGFVAQDVEEILPELVSKSGEFKTVNYIQMIAMLVEVVKKQDRRISELEKK